MESVKYNNRFKVTYCGKVVRLNSTYDVNGNSRLIFGFDSILEAQDAAKLFCSLSNLDINHCHIVPYGVNVKAYWPELSPETSAYVKAIKKFSGKGLQYNAIRYPKENKYSEGKYYGPEVRLAQSVTFAKGVSTIAHLKDKKQSTGGLNDWQRIKHSKGGEFTIDFDLVTSLKEKKWANRKEVKEYLKARGYSVRTIKKLLSKVYAA